jgi:GT2 family glycosyltransferase
MSIESAESVRVTVVIVTFQARDFLIACLKSILEASNDLIVEVYVIDNASTDGTAEVLRKEWSTVKLIRNARNVGFAKATNMGLKVARGEHVMILNPDTILRADTIRKLLEAAAYYPFSVIGPRLVGIDGTWQRSHWDFPTLRWITMNELGMPKRVYGQSNSIVMNDSLEPRTVDWLAGTCLFMGRSTLEKIGYLSEEFFMYMEDIDFCRRARSSGCTVLYYPLAEVVHAGGISSAAESRQSGITQWQRQELRNRVNYFRLNYGKAAAACVLLAHAVGLITRPVFEAIRHVIRQMKA